MVVVAGIAFALALLPMLMMIRNLNRFERSPSPTHPDAKIQNIRISILIPARNEATSIGPAIESILDSDHRAFELLILDDHSEDATPKIVQSFEQQDSRVRLLRSAPLPTGWNGKQHACWQLANAAHCEWFLFLDADVRLAHDGLSRCILEQHRRNVPLVSGFPFQETGTLAEKMLIPMMHFLLLGFLPIDRMRRLASPSLAAGCGQLFFAERDSYFSAGGHAAISGSRHDGIMLPRTFRRAGMMTDIFDATDIARCRMYQSMKQVTRGLLKNATEGIANPQLIVPFSVLLLGSSVLPIAVLIAIAIRGSSVGGTVLAVLSVGLSYGPRGLTTYRFQQSWVGFVLHPICVLWFVALQWLALAKSFLGFKTLWRGRE